MSIKSRLNKLQMKRPDKGSVWAKVMSNGLEGSGISIPTIKDNLAGTPLGAILKEHWTRLGIDEADGFKSLEGVDPIEEAIRLV